MKREGPRSSKAHRHSRDEQEKRGYAEDHVQLEQGPLIVYQESDPYGSRKADSKTPMKQTCGSVPDEDLIHGCFRFELKDGMGLSGGGGTRQPDNT